MSLPRITLFRGQTVDGKKPEGDLIQLEGYPHRFIQNEKGGNEAIIYDSEEIMIGGEWFPVSKVQP
jgi:hypothetical protein